MTAMPDYPPGSYEPAPLLAIAVLLLGLMTFALVGGRELRSWLARRRVLQHASGHDYEGYIVSSVLGLLAILLGFTFSLSISRYEERRQLVISHANAIETAYLRAQLLDAPHRERLGHLLTIYNDNLIELTSAKPAQVPMLVANDSVILTEIWAATAAATDAVRSIPLSLALTESVNRLIDLDAARRALLIVRIPTAVFLVLFIYHVGAAGVLGYVLTERAGLFAGGFLLILMSLALLLVVDINQPASGSIRTDNLPSLEVREFIKSQPPAVFDRWRNGLEPVSIASPANAVPTLSPLPALSPPPAPRVRRSRARARDARGRQ